MRTELYKVPNNSKIKVIGDIKTPPYSIDIKEGDILTFKKIDGMYSLCYNSKQQIVHLSAWAQVEIL